MIRERESMDALYPVKEGRQLKPAIPLRRRCRVQSHFSALSIVQLMAIALAILALPRAGSAEETRLDPPNIVWISLEDITPMMGCYGDTYARTPVFDNLAAEGIRYTKAHSIAPVCSVSRSSIITGMYPTSLGTHHHRSNVGQPPAFVKMLPNLMRGAGYYTSNNAKKYQHLAPAKPGSAIDGLVTLMDLGPSTLALAGLATPDWMHGQALLGKTGEGEIRYRDYVIGMRDRLDSRYEMVRTVRDQRFRYQRNYYPHLPFKPHEDYEFNAPLLKKWVALAREGKLTGPQAMLNLRFKPIEELYDSN